MICAEGAISRIVEGANAWVARREAAGERQVLSARLDLPLLSLGRHKPVGDNTLRVCHKITRTF
jgi:hypothetical protein